MAFMQRYQQPIAIFFFFFLSLLSFIFLLFSFPLCPFPSRVLKTQIEMVMADNDTKSSSVIIQNPGMENKEGEMNVLQKHVAFFDRNNDGIIYPWETYQGFRAIGSGVFLSGFASIFINMGLSSKTRPGKWFSPALPIVIQNIHMSKHGSDSGVYDSQGRFVNSKFEEIFKKHAHTHEHALTSDELSGMLKANREPKDFGGWVGAYSEWKILYYLCKDKDGLLHKNVIKSVYDGSLFEHMEAEKLSKKQKTRASM